MDGLCGFLARRVDRAVASTSAHRRRCSGLLGNHVLFGHSCSDSGLNRGRRRGKRNRVEGHLARARVITAELRVAVGVIRVFLAPRLLDGVRFFMLLWVPLFEIVLGPAFDDVGHVPSYGRWSGLGVAPPWTPPISYSD